VDAGVSEGNRYDCTVEMFLDEAADRSGNTLTAKFRTKDGGSGEWTAKRYSEMKAVPRDGGKITSFNFKDKKIFDRVTEDIAKKKAVDAEKRREEYFAEASTFPWLDGAILYIPPPSVGSDYMSIVDIERHVRAMQVEQVDRYKARLEADLPVIKALMEAGKGDVLKKRFNMDADIAKRFCDLYERLLKGEAMADKLKERRAFKPGMGQFHPESEKPLEHIPDPYMADYELYRKLKRDEPKHWEEFTAKLQKEIDWMTANMDNAEKLKTRSMDGDMAKRKVDIYSRMIKGEANLGKLKERPSFKPNNPSWHPESEKQAEHMPDEYFSSVELDRELGRRDKKHWEEYKAHLIVSRRERGRGDGREETDHPAAFSHRLAPPHSPSSFPIPSPAGRGGDADQDRRGR
jgi:hypothetical protein